MTSHKLRQSFLDFFKSKKHKEIPYSSLIPPSENLLFTNAGMNQFTDYFLGFQSPNYNPPRAVSYQKCIRAGGKHNDLEDVGYDLYHHTFFEMLGNWSFGDYYKEEAICWAWELLVEKWKFPKNRLYATIYKPKEGDPASYDKEAYDIWCSIFERENLDPKIHIVEGTKKDNFWMMGDTGPCGPCSEIHMDITPNGDSNGSLVNKGDSLCIELWNLVFIEFYSDGQGKYSKLPVSHVDTGMGFERVCSIIQGTDKFKNFDVTISNYNTDIFSPLIQELYNISQKNYIDDLSKGINSEQSDQDKINVAFRVIVDHIRTISFSIADGIEPGNSGRNYVIRNLIRRAIRFGRVLGFDAQNNFLYKLVPVLVKQMGSSFPELKKNEKKIITTIDREESQFNKTLDRGIDLFNASIKKLSPNELFPAKSVVTMWETYGFPVDLTKSLLVEKSISVDEDELKSLIESHKNTGVKGLVTKKIHALKFNSNKETKFVGYSDLEVQANVLEWIEEDKSFFAIVDKNPFYIEKGGQVSDSGTLSFNDFNFDILSVFSVNKAVAIEISNNKNDEEEKDKNGLISISDLSDKVLLKVNKEKRDEIRKHHTATHLLHWALHQVVDFDIKQHGSLVKEDKLRFDFNSEALTQDQINRLEIQINSCILSDDPIFVEELPYLEVKDNIDIIQFFDDKYGDIVRVVQIGGSESNLDGYSMELCGGTHVDTTKDINFFKIKSESSISSGIRRIEAVCGISAFKLINLEYEDVLKEVSELRNKIKLIKDDFKKYKLKFVEFDDNFNIQKDIEKLLAKKTLVEANNSLKDFKLLRDDINKFVNESNKTLKKQISKETLIQASKWYEDNISDYSGNFWIGALSNDYPNLLQESINTIKSRDFKITFVLIFATDNSLNVAVIVPKRFLDKFNAPDILNEILRPIGGKGGGKPDLARGAASIKGLENREIKKNIENIISKSKDLLNNLN